MTANETAAYVHGEAFMLMHYQCRGCGHHEIIWNSRDGITPFGVTCHNCGGMAQHVNWQGDVRAPDHIPGIGERCFIDLHPEKALRERRAFVDEWWDHPEMPMREHPYLGPLGKDGAAADLAKDDIDSFAPHTPDLVEVDDAVLAYLDRQRSSARTVPPGGGS